MNETVMTRARPRTLVPVLILGIGILFTGCKSKNPDPRDPDPVSELQLSSGSAELRADAPSQNIRLTSSGTVALDGLSAHIAYGAGQPTDWLTAQLSQTTTPADLVLTRNRDLPAGEYQATIRVATAGKPDAATISVALVEPADPKPVPDLQLSTHTLEFRAATTGPEAAPQRIDVTSKGDGELASLAASVEYETGQPSGWLEARLDSAKAPTTLTITASRQNLPAGAHTASLVVTDAPMGKRAEVLVRFVLTRLPSIDLDRVQLTFESYDSAPGAEAVKITNSGGGSLTGLTAKVDGYGKNQPTGWLDVHLDAKTVPATVTLTASPTSLAAGTYTAVVAIGAAGANNSPGLISVTYRRRTVPGPALSEPQVTSRPGNLARVKLQWSYTWPATSHAGNAFLLEESTVGAGTGFRQIARFELGRSRPKDHSHELERSAGLYFYRVRAVEARGVSEFSSARSAHVGQVTATRFHNETVWELLSYKIDGKLYNRIIDPGKSTLHNLATGQHTYEATFGYSALLFGVFTLKGSFQQLQGVVGSVKSSPIHRSTAS